MTALVVPRPDMPGFSSLDMDDVHTPSSDFSFYQAAVAPAGMFSFSSSQTGPSSDPLSGSSWDTTGEGTQNFQQDFLDTGSSHPGDAEDFAFTLDGHITPRGQQQANAAVEDMQPKWTGVSSATPVASVLGGEPMKRGSSRTSTGSQKHRIAKPSSKARSTINLSSKMSAHLSNLDMSGNLYSNGPQSGNPMAGMNQCLFLDTDASGVSSQMLYSGIPMGLGMGSDGIPSPSDMGMHVVPAHMQLDPDASLTSHSPSASWTSFSPAESHLTSPAGSPEEAWLPEPLVASPPRSHNGSPSLQLPCDDGKLPGQELIANDLSGAMMPLINDDFTFSTSYTARRASSEGESARDHPLYKNAAPGPDGLFHCPWEGQASCNHKAEKLKCNYDKFVDSHLKPYRCKDPSCENARFSSTACLLRHEREAHAMHGHGDKPFLCTYDGCDRSMHGNGFPRQWNLRDHMRRVHNDNRLPGSPTGPVASQQVSKSRKRKDAPKAAPASTRKTTVKPAVVEAASREAPAPRPLIEEWISNQKALEDIIRSLGQPEDARNVQLIKQAQGRLSAMSKMALPMGNVQQHQVPLHSTFG